jgi:hypothetical protein
MPDDLSSWMLQQCTGIAVSASTLWNWVERYGASSKSRLEAQLEQYLQGESMPRESLDDVTAALRLAIAADGVMVPFRPHPKTPKGKIQWREVKVGLLVRLGHRITRAGKQVTRWCRRRLVAVLGDVDTFIPRIHLEAQLQSYACAPQVIWLSDGGRGFCGVCAVGFPDHATDPSRRVYRQCFADCAIGILDFYHAAGHLWRATVALFDGHSPDAIHWFKRWRSLLRHGHHQTVLDSLASLVSTDLAQGEDLETVQQVQAYFQTHRQHIRYHSFKRQQCPLGSGMIESACKWLIQQRFKGVGMRWSEDGFNHLLHLRLDWINHRFDSLFPHVSIRQIDPSHNR